MVEDHTLEALRGELDKIDVQLLNTIKARLDCCVQIALHKREHHIPMMQPNRIHFVHERAAQFAEASHIRADFLRQLYELIISETCRVEDIIIGHTGVGGQP
ncbi:chorismate mutase family protein [Paenibacillus spiritus]|uniref:Chorismate mutase family protein n=1 Tax=Paenibacillus spiritus TaxID=2496557 RepID=A0A5J5GBT7_9BACL|nr:MULTISPECIES: chorismate mutase family protein [Paenibacillus]KAA9005471.1 chorismate mutase family protein [Paenibacillus spiritus]